MSKTFVRTSPGTYGYNTEQVDAFIALAKEQFQHPDQKQLDVQTIRAMRFDLVKGGYSISAVDSATEKLEDVFAERELQRSRLELGQLVFQDMFNELSQLLASRVSRSKGKRFNRRAWPNRGYNTKQVDLLCSQVAKHLDRVETLTVRDVRLSAFKSRRGGYAEHQVDAFIDKVVELIQRQDILQKSTN
jgi:DivIVA domain-containing protein